MKILHVTRDFPPRGNGGISTAVGGLVRALESTGINNAVVSFDGYRPKTRTPCPGAPEVTEAASADILRVVHPGQLDDASAWGRAQGATIVHCHHDLLWTFAKSIDGPVTLATAHILQREQNRLRGLEGPTLSSDAQDRVMLQADRIFAPSRAASDTLVRDYPDYAERIQLVPLAIDDRPLAPGTKAGVLYLGRFSDIRGVGDFIDAIPLFASSSPSITIVGGVPDSPRADRRWRDKIRDRANVLQIDIDAPGWVSPQSAWLYLERAAIVVIPSWTETFGMAAAEAMLAGCAIVASDIAPLRELVTEKAAVLVPPRSPAAIASAINDLHRDPQRRIAMAQLARSHIRERAIWPRRIAESIRAYESAAATRPRNAL